MDYLKFDCEKLRLEEVETHSVDGKTTYINQYLKYGDKKKDLKLVLRIPVFLFSFLEGLWSKI